MNSELSISRRNALAIGLEIQTKMRVYGYDESTDG